jgi:hypothetical protein
MMHTDIISHLLNVCWWRNHDWDKLFIIDLAVATKVQLELERIERVFHFWEQGVKVKIKQNNF